MAIQVPDLEPFILNDRSAVKYYLFFAFLVFSIGIFVIALTFHPSFRPTQLVDLTQKVGGAFVSSLSAFPIKEYLLRRDRIRIVRALQIRIDVLLGSSGTSDDDLRRVTDIVWKMYEKGVAG
ncbi:hypothetical protein [Rhizobium leguminosarum]|uniref:hypothetical protein n=1 Tax=Rhizobium leguminosarum TaxID=384 RepID=UPI000FEC392F|nr:hypothetical protein [Rhizobium leguminosarum]RWX24510.1 hypothetical protein EHI43_31940 [Rhizobium leguminosarum]